MKQHEEGLRTTTLGLARAGERQALPMTFQLRTYILSRHPNDVKHQGSLRSDASFHVASGIGPGREV